MGMNTNVFAVDMYLLCLIDENNSIIQCYYYVVVSRHIFRATTNIVNTHNTPAKTIGRRSYKYIMPASYRRLYEKLTEPNNTETWWLLYTFNISVYISENIYEIRKYAEIKVDKIQIEVRKTAVSGLIIYWYRSWVCEEEAWTLSSAKASYQKINLWVLRKWKKILKIIKPRVKTAPKNITKKDEEAPINTFLLCSRWYQYGEEQCDSYCRLNDSQKKQIFIKWGRCFSWWSWR